MMNDAKELLNSTPLLGPRGPQRRAPPFVLMRQASPGRESMRRSSDVARGGKVKRAGVTLRIIVVKQQVGVYLV